MRNKIFLLALFLSLGAFFHTQLLGALARFALSYHYDCQLAYRSVYWEEGALVFRDVVVFDPTFDAHIEKVSLQFDGSDFPHKMRGHLICDRPHLSFLKKRALPKWQETAGWFDWTFSLNEGLVEWEGPASFSLDYRKEGALLRLDWEDAGAILALSDGKIEADLRKCRAALFKPLLEIGEIQAGFLSGRVQMGIDQKIYAANLKLEQFAMTLPLGGVIEEVAGTLSYNGNLGAKWELKGRGGGRGELIPFDCQGRGFFKSRWLESDIHFGSAFCKISGDETWKVECQDLLASHATLLQAPLAYLYPDLAAWSFCEGKVSGEGTFSPQGWSAQFLGEKVQLKKGEQLLRCAEIKGELTQEGGSVSIQAEDFAFAIQGTWQNFRAEARVLTSHFSLQGEWDGEKFPLQITSGKWGSCQFLGKGWIDPSCDFLFDLNGEWAFGKGKIPFYCPRLEKKGESYSFDLRLARKTWDLFRLVGTYQQAELTFDAKSHLLGAPLHFASKQFGSLEATTSLSWASVQSADLFLREWGLNIAPLPSLGTVSLHLQYGSGPAKISAQGVDPPFAFQAEQAEQGWQICLHSDLSLKGWVSAEGEVKGDASWKERGQCAFEGKISPSLQGELYLSHICCDLAPFDFYGMQGILQGEGRIHYRADTEAEFEFAVSSLKIQEQLLENKGSLRLSYSSASGILVKGVNLQGQGPLHCKIDLLEYDASRSHWIFHRAQVDLPTSFLTHRYLRFLDPKSDLHFSADLDFAADFSRFTCTMLAGDIPIDHEMRHIENLHLYWSHSEGKAAFYYRGQLYRLRLNLDDKIQGRLVIGEAEDPLTIDWEYQDDLLIQSIEGEFAGIEASFHAESPHCLIGSARLNFNALQPFLPADVAEVFTELKMGKGYELKGRLYFEKNRPSFQGILAGKQIELFGFQFRTLMAQIAFSLEELSLTNLKISDTAGVMKIDALHLDGKGEGPWTISIPELAIFDLRPSLLQRPGEEVGPISPLVVRELVLSDFRGLLDESQTYTAKGKLHFINSYKREETVFDIPANVLSRIVGIDLDLLIPVRGDLIFELKEGNFYLQQLLNAYSEGDRSEFFLEMDPPPTMDLDGNLQIFIKMKQFVLLKITESFLISIEGKLNDPDFHLQKKRFFGLI